MIDLSRISIGVKTFLRDNLLENTISAILRNIPECMMIIADDGETSDEKDLLYTDLTRRNHKILQLPFDSGFGYKSNQIVEVLDTDLFLIASDDFDFNPPEVRQGIEKLQDVLDNTDIDIASGRVDNRAYEFNLIDTGDTIKEIPVEIKKGEFDIWYYDCDLTVNYSLIKKRVFEKVRWDDEVRIGGGEHGSFFVDCKRAGFKTAYVPGVNINELKGPRSARYREFRNRALSPERPCFVKRGIKEYILGNGQVDYKCAS